MAIEESWPEHLLAEHEEGISDLNANVPGFAVLFIFLTAQTTAQAIYEEKRVGSFRRLRAAPISKATILFGTSSVLGLYVANQAVQPLMLGSLRVVVSGAERLSAKVRHDFELKFGKRIYEGYGATETTPVATVNIPDAMDTTDWKVQQGNIPGSVGMPLPGTSIRVVDPQTLEQRPLGEDGLILISGSQVMLGYLNDEEKTAEVISEIDGTRWFHSGDLGHLTEEGFLIIK